MATETKAPRTKATAILELIDDYRKSSMTPTSLRRVLRALNELECNLDECLAILCRLDYLDHAHKAYRPEFQPILDKQLPPA